MMKRKDRQEYTKYWKRARREMLLQDRAERLQQQQQSPQHPQPQMTEECEEEPELMMRNFMVVEFADCAVEVVPSSWVDRSTEVVSCYCTTLNVRAHVKACHLPNSSWTKYPVKKIWLCTDSYAKAVERCRQLMDTSSIKTEDEASVHKRQRRRPRRFMTDSSSDDESVAQPEKHSRMERVSGSPFSLQIPLPPPPAYVSTPCRKPAGCPELDDESLVTLARPATSSWDPVEELTQRDRSHPTEGGGSSMAMEMRSLRASINRMEQLIHVLKDKMDELLRRTLSPPAPPVDDVLLSPCSTVTELQELDSSLCQPERRNNMKLFLTSLGGSTGGDAIRRMLRRVATNDVLTQYSLRGRKAKKAFQDLAVCRVITAACQKNFPALTAAEAEDLIGQFLKFAPHRRPAEKD